MAQPLRGLGWLLAGAIVLLAALLVSWSLRPHNPYVRSVLALTGDRDRGQAIFAMNCATCHGATAMGNVGPSLQAVSDRKSAVGLIEQVVGGKTPPMPQFQPEPQDMADLLRYLQQL